MKISSPVGTVPKIGPKYKKLLENLGIFTVKDLLYHFPFRYDDFSNVKKISEVKEGDIVTVKGIVESVQNIFTRNGKRLTRIKISDRADEIDLIFFNQHYLKTTIKTGKEYFISGKVGFFDRNLSFISPEIEESREVMLNTGRLVPVYPETYGVTSKWLRSRINDVSLVYKETNEFIPNSVLIKENLLDINTALKKIHFPSNAEEAKDAKRRFQFEELFLELLKVEKKRFEWTERLKTHPMDINNPQIDRLVQSLGFKLTLSQERAVKKILSEMSEKHPMNMLLEGDVGTGKTVVALIAAYVSYLNKRKTLYMAPTEILALQHYDTFKKTLGSFGVSTAVITGSKKEGFQEADILIGTHALIYSKNDFTDVGLVIIDEQHRFGVEQRGKIVDMAKNSKTPHLLTMTATPIPRTLALTIYGDLSITTLDTHPNEQRKITTKVATPVSRDKVYQWIAQKNEQTFIVCPLIEESDAEMLENVKAAEKEYTDLKKTYFKDTEVGLLHGRMKPKEKEEIINKFRKGQLKVLVSTPVVEVGIDIPEATIMVIESAERYGLASLHQLRGRVGRGLKEGFCFAMLTNNSRQAYQRLKNLETVDNGLKLAEIDMKLRGEGDIFGASQHGFKKFKIANIYDTTMLESAKDSAKEIYPLLDQYPALKEKLTEEAGEYIPNN